MIKNNVIKYLVGSIILILLTLSGITYYMSHNYLFFSRHKPYAFTPEDFNLNYKTVNFFPQGHRVNLTGWFLPGDHPEGKAPAVLLVHGHHSNMSNNSDVNILRDVAIPLNQAGYAVLLFDLRNHGNSGDLKPVSLGYYESQDVLGAMNFLKDNADELSINHNKLGLWATSMGGAAAIHAASLNFQSNKNNIKALFIDSTYAQTLDPIKLRLENDGVPGLLKQMVIYWIRTIPEIDIGHFNPIEHIQSISAPIYFVHAKNDKIVNYKDSELMAKEFKNHHPQIDSFLWITGAKRHVHNFKEYPKEYTKMLVKFFKSYL